MPDQAASTAAPAAADTVLHVGFTNCATLQKHPIYALYLSYGSWGCWAIAAVVAAAADCPAVRSRNEREHADN